ncbi:hypothetical protein NMG60_11009694 [Bertholletia excelsa]
MAPRSNLQRFLHSVTPRVPSKLLPQGWVDDLSNPWHPIGNNPIEYFTLGDLWDCYDEWSAYGTGTPVVLNNGDTVDQYFVPYLSAIQIYTNQSCQSLSSRTSKEDIDVSECEVEFWSDDSGSDKLSRSLSNNSSRAWDVASADSSLDHDGSWVMNDRLGYLYFQYFETCSPYWRTPLVDRITEFAHTYPGLLTLKSIHLSPASWMAVSWYPIYHIPAKGSVKDLSACFLTFHTLSSFFQDTEVDEDLEIRNEISCSEVLEEILGRNSRRGYTGEVSLPPFGLATYKMQGDVWINPQACDDERLIYLYSAADSWLKQLGVHHHDFSFFTTHSAATAAAAADVGTLV